MQVKPRIRTKETNYDEVRAGGSRDSEVQLSGASSDPISSHVSMTLLEPRWNSIFSES